jgi:hypothetical protein
MEIMADVAEAERIVTAAAAAAVLVVTEVPLLTSRKS